MERPPLPEATLSDFLLWLMRRRKRVRVVGESMTPTLNEGVTVFVDTRAYRNDSPMPGEIVVALKPYHHDLRLIKRVERITEEGQIFLVSDNPSAGTDSRSFGAVAPERVLGRVVCRINGEL